MVNFPILSLLIFLPLIGALAILTVRGDEKHTASNAMNVGLFASIFNLGVALYMASQFRDGTHEFQFVENYEWLPSMNISYSLGVDGISMLFVLLSAFLTPICILASYNSVKKRVREYVVAFLILETFMIGTFCAIDSFLFYVFFEGVLLPMFLIIGIWGGAQRIYASYKFFLFTLLGSVLMLVGLLYMYNKAGTSDMQALMNYDFTFKMQFWLWLAFFASFAVKMPMWPVHTWLPAAHVEAPTAGSVILAGVLLKMGGYGFLRFSLPMFPEASAYFAPMVYWLSVIAIVYTSLVALVQTDMKKLIAYSSVAHMGYVTLGLFTATAQGIEGGIFQMVSHGIISAALFLCVGVVYDRLHTREINRYGGLVQNMPKYATVFMIFMLGSVGLPGTSGFVGEILSLLGAYQVSPGIAFIATTGVIFGAAYMLILYKRVVFGEQKNADAAEMKDLNKEEYICLVPLAILTIWLGVQPMMIMDKLSPSVAHLQSQISSAFEAQSHNFISQASRAEIEIMKARQDSGHQNGHEMEDDHEHLDSREINEEDDNAEEIAE